MEIVGEAGSKDCTEGLGWMMSGVVIKNKEYRIQNSEFRIQNMAARKVGVSIHDLLITKY